MSWSPRRALLRSSSTRPIPFLPRPIQETCRRRPAPSACSLMSCTRAPSATLIQLRAGGLLIGPDSFLFGRSAQLAALTVRYASRRSSKAASSSPLAAWRAMAATKPTLTVWPASTLPVLSKGESLASCRSSGARKLNCSLTSRLRRRSASPSRCPCPAAPTR